MRGPRQASRSRWAQSPIVGWRGTGTRHPGGATAPFENRYCRWLFALSGSADFRPGSPQPIRAPAVAASPPTCVYTGVAETPQATAKPLILSIFVPAPRARRLVRRVQMTTREISLSAPINITNFSGLENYQGKP